MAISIRGGQLCTEPINLGLTIIQPVKKQESIKYLGVNFEDEIVFDSSRLLTMMGKSMETLVATPVLHPHQKIAIINQFVWPKLIYSMQSTKISNIPQTFLEAVNKLIRSSTREILALPQDSPNSMLYSASNIKD